MSLTHAQRAMIAAAEAIKREERTHAITEDGESTLNWAINQPGFLGSIKQLTNCGRCGERLPFKRHDQPRHYADIFKPTFHVLCDECFEALP